MFPRSDRKRGFLMKGMMNKVFRSFVCVLALCMIMSVPVFADVANAVKITTVLPSDDFNRPITVNFMNDTGDYSVTLKTKNNYSSTISLPAGEYVVTNAAAMNDTKGVYSIHCDKYSFTVADGQSDPIPIALTVYEEGSLVNNAPIDSVSEEVIEEPNVEDESDTEVEFTAKDELDSDANAFETDESEEKADSMDKEKEERSRFIKSTIMTGLIFIGLGGFWVYRKKFMD